MDSKNWILLLSVLGIIGFSSYYILQNPYQSGEIAQITPTEVPEVASYSERPGDWKEYAGKTVKFYHPEKWLPEEKEPFGGTVVEDILLNIPDATDNSVYYSVTPYEIVKPDDVVKEEELVINDRRWIKWTREGENYVSYDYYTNEHQLLDEAESFGVHVTMAERDDELERELTTFIYTIEFSEIEEDL